ncbi:hypothetical protein Y032_0357g3386 [Ancylostoma ceylanicum]|uniref:Uncharacterized protein n=1 Tax=Ancylostoma ceylanicum TaxID=53326 RepID=A0A016RW62_9BILA|nr:hypothetical protein Y032_0357g3386 [Ancylostoma ceylanicum]
MKEERKKESYRKDIRHQLFLTMPEHKNLCCNLKHLFWEKAKSSCKEVSGTCSTKRLLVHLDAKVALSPEK